MGENGMNNFYFVNIQHLTNGETAKVIYQYDSREECMSAYHSALLYNYRAEDVESFTCIALNDYGTLGWEAYERPKEQSNEMNEIDGV